MSGEYLRHWDSSSMKTKRWVMKKRREQKKRGEELKNSNTKKKLWTLPTPKWTGTAAPTDPLRRWYEKCIVNCNMMQISDARCSLGVFSHTFLSFLLCDFRWWWCDGHETNCEAAKESVEKLYKWSRGTNHHCDTRSREKKSYTRIYMNDKRGVKLVKLFFCSLCSLHWVDDDGRRSVEEKWRAAGRLGILAGKCDEVEKERSEINKFISWMLWHERIHFSLRKTTKNSRPQR